MGLDNAIYVRAHKKVKTPPEVMWRGYTDNWNEASFYGHEKDDGLYIEGCFDRELCYWRKCWNIRGLVLEIVGDRYDGRGGSVTLTVDDLNKFYKALFNLNSSKGWKNNDSSIWEYKEMRDVLDQDLTNLEWLIWYMNQENNQVEEVFFIDSY